MVEDFVLNMTNNNIELRKHCASAIFKCAQVKVQMVNLGGGSVTKTTTRWLMTRQCVNDGTSVVIIS